MIRAEPILHIAVPVEFRDALLVEDVAQIGVPLLKVRILRLQMFKTETKITKMFISQYESKSLDYKFYKILHLKVVSCEDLRKTFAVILSNHSGREIGNHQLLECVIYFTLRFSVFPNLCFHFPSVV